MIEAIAYIIGFMIGTALVDFLIFISLGSLVCFIAWLVRRSE